MKRLLLLLALALPATAAAQDAASEGASPEHTAERSAALAHGHRGLLSAPSAGTFQPWIDFALFSGPYRASPNAYTVLGTQLGASMGIEREARLHVDWGFAYAMAHVAGTISTATSPIDYDTNLERVEAQNPVIGFDWLPWLGTNARLGLGLSLVIPAAAVQRFGDRNQAGPTNATDAAIFDASRTLHDLAMGMSGAWSPWRYQPERFGLALPISLGFDLGSVVLAFDGALALSFPVLGGQGVIDGIAQLAAELYGTPVTFDAGGLSLGLRASVVGYHLGAGAEVSEDVRDAGQPAFEPWLRVDVRPVMLTLRGVLNVGGPFGLGTETGVWAIHVGGGLAID